MDFPIQSTLVCFTKLCDDKNEIPCFNGREMNKFFYRIEKEYPKLFEDRLTSDIDEEVFTFKVSRILQSISPDFHPYLMSRGSGLIIYEKNKDKYEKEIYEVAQKFYDELGCDLEGKLGAHTKLAK
jgi:hypothetical protein